MRANLGLFRLDGKVAIITGASRGIGNAIAHGLASVGAKVIGLGRSDSTQDESTSFDYRVCDVRDMACFAKLAEDVYLRFGSIDILVNAAAITQPVEDGVDQSDAFRRTLTCNLSAVFDTCIVVIPYMLRGGYGSVINITSIGANLGFPGNPGYISSKGGLASLTRSLALDYGSKGIRVNSLVPGYFHTSMTQASYSDLKRRRARAVRTMLGRWGDPEELVGPAIFLASPASSYVTGSELFVDGGWTAKGL